ncbi:hypothetical protein [Vibrio paucivorans]
MSSSLNYHNIPKFVKVLSSMSISLVLWVCLFGLELKKAVDAGFNFFDLIHPVNVGGSLIYKINSSMIDVLFNESLTLHILVVIIISLLSTTALSALVRYQTSKTIDIGESHRVFVVKFSPYENELLLKSSALITIVTVLYTASTELAFIATLLLSFYSPIWPYNSLVCFKGIMFAKASVILDRESNVTDEFVVITTKNIIQNFTYNPRSPQRMDIMLYNKISVIR